MACAGRAGQCSRGILNSLWCRIPCAWRLPICPLPPPPPHPATPELDEVPVVAVDAAVAVGAPRRLDAPRGCVAPPKRGVARRPLLFYRSDVGALRAARGCNHCTAHLKRPPQHQRAQGRQMAQLRDAHEAISTGWQSALRAPSPLPCMHALAHSPMLTQVQQPAATPCMLVHQGLMRLALPRPIARCRARRMSRGLCAPASQVGQPNAFHIAMHARPLSHP